MTDYIPADDVRELRDRLRREARAAVYVPSDKIVNQTANNIADVLDSLLAQAQPCDEELREALAEIVRLSEDAYDIRTVKQLGTKARTALAEEGK